MTHSDQMQNSIREFERLRLEALVTGDLTAANLLHADDFQLITPSGRLLSKQDYLGGVASGHLNYRLWEIDSEIEVRLFRGCGAHPLPLAIAHVTRRRGRRATAILAYRFLRTA